MSEGISPERAAHFTLSEQDAADGGIFITKNPPADSDPGRNDEEAGDGDGDEGLGLFSVE